YGVQPGEQQLRSLAIDGAGAGVWEWNERRGEIKVSPLVEATLGLKAGQLSAKLEDFTKHMHPTDRERFRLVLSSVKERPDGELRAEFRMRHADSSYRWFELEAAAAPVTDRRNARCIGLLRDVTDTKRAQERLLHDAVQESLSGLPNRELFLDRLAIVAKRATLEPLVRPALIFINIDKFKSVNGSFGLIVGDSLLLTISRRLARNLGPQDTLARVGGDQFALLLLSQSNPSELAMLAEQVRRSLRAPISIAGREIVLTASIGIALYDGPDEDPAELLREAEIAMYRAKRTGPDRIEIFNAAMRTEKDGRPALESELQRAVEKKQLKLVYQPIYYLPTESLAGFEALLRWDHPTRGTLGEAEFMPIAEESDLIGQLGSYVLARAVREAARWQKELPRPDAPVFVSVNVASRQLFRPDLVKEVRHILGRAVLPRGSLRLEIAESLVMDNPEKATAVLRELADAGTGLALDDFATGYSSLSYLNQFIFDAIKVDRSFLQANGENGAGSVILRSIVALAHELGKNVGVEGVETEDEVGLLRTIGCHYGQGFYYGEPMPERDALQLVKLARRTERRMKRRSLLRRRMVTDELPDEPAPTQSSEPPRQPPAQPPVHAAAPVPRKAALVQSPPRGPTPVPPSRSAGRPPPLPAAAKSNAGLRAMPPSPVLRPDARPPEAVTPSPPRPAAASAPQSLAIAAAPSPAKPQANGARAAAPAAPLPIQSAQPRTGPPPLPRTPAPDQRQAPPPLPADPARSTPQATPPPARPNGRAANLSKLPPVIAESLARLAGWKEGSSVNSPGPATSAAGTSAPPPVDGDGKPPAN
ncbi:MAG TPA: EAL domain-containing protein, partial [Hyphomicrobiaceae bacterium]|nr:EAL domain-containing protein [Hyphomicrobiaceae bacterium]